MSISTKEINNGVVLYLKEDISVDSVKNLHTLVEPFLANEIKNMIFDFEGVDYICSAGLGVIANAYKKLAQASGHVYATNVSGRIMKIFEATTLDQFLILRDNTDTLIESIKEKT